MAKAAKKDTLVGGNKTLKPGGMKGKGGSATGMKNAMNAGKKSPFSKGK